MDEHVDEHFVRRVSGWLTDADEVQTLGDPLGASVPPERLLACFEAQLLSRHLDLAARWLQQRGAGYYTISSAGHESNAALALALRPTDPALLHYRSGGFYVARAGQVPGSTPVADVLSGVVASTDDPISGGRHKVFGHPALSVIPQTSTIGSHLPRAFGLAFSLGRARALDLRTRWPDDAVVVASFGDASANHSTTLGALNAAAYCTSRGVPVPMLLVCEDNGLGISVPTPAGWLEQALGRWPGIDYVAVDGTRPAEVLQRADEAVRTVRAGRRPVLIHLRTVRFLGHAGSDVELAYRSRAEIRRDFERDPLLATAATLVRTGTADAHEVLDRYERGREVVMAEASRLVGATRLSDAAVVMAPLTSRRPAEVRAAVLRTQVDPVGRSAAPVTLAGAINATLVDVLASWPQALVFGEDVAAKGGVYGLTRGLRKRFGGLRVFDTLLDEQTVLGTALGAALAGFLPIPEIQYLAYLHNAEDQLRGEGASLAFFSDGQYTNPMVVRVAGFGYQKGFGGHFHNDGSVAVLRDVPGLVVAVPSHPAEAPALLRTCVGLAAEEGRVCVFLEPIALYHERDLFDGDGEWLAPYRPPSEDDADAFGTVTTYGTGEDLLLVSFGNGVRLSRRAAARLGDEAISCTVLDLRWLAPLPYDDLVRHARRFGHVLVVDESRASGGVAEGVLAGLADAGYEGIARRVASRDSYVPLGPAAKVVLVSEEDVVREARALLGPGSMGATPPGGGRHARRTAARSQDVDGVPAMSPVAVRAREILARIGVPDPFDEAGDAGDIVARTPVDGSEIGRLRAHTADEVAAVVADAQRAFEEWRTVPAPVRGQLVRELGMLLREHHDDLGALVSIEAGKIASEGLGEVQEMIDICDLAVGLSRQLHGLTIASERPGHRMMEQWHPLGVVGVISAFNFPVAVWSWNAALALVCGDAVVWKPSEKTPLTALACQALAVEAARRTGAPEHLTSVLVGDAAVGTALVDDRRVALVSATGSTRMGKVVAPRVAGRLGRLLLELGGNNAAIVTPSADLDLAVRAIVFSAVGTAGQRCTSLRRVIAHSSVHDDLVDRLRKAYETLPIGSPLDASTLVGPLVDASAGAAFTAAVEQAVRDGGTVLTGGDQEGAQPLEGAEGGGCYVRPAIVTMPAQTDIVKTETFAPLLYVLSYDELDEAIALHNEVAQGLSSSIFTLDVREAERFVSATGSDCGIANVNVGPSGAEIGGAFGGEKDTGGGRESGSDAWKSYMRRTTNTVNYTTELPLAQGVQFL